MTYNRVHSRPTIGLFIDWLENPYHISLISGIQKKAEEEEINLIIFVGGCIHTSRKWEQPRNIIYKFVKEETLDGLIISAGSVGHYSTQEQIIKFVQSYSFLPVITISQPVPSIPAILIDNRSGLEKMILHLINDHHYKNIAMITGPSGNLESEERLHVYKTTLERCGYSFNEDLIAHGTFVYQSGIQAMSQLFEKNIPIDAVVAANDDMALGVIEYLKKEKIHIPGEIAVVGFDDMVLSKYSHPPLTTIQQPIEEQGLKAVELILALIHGETVPLKTNLYTELIIRESCGCLPESVRYFPHRVKNSINPVNQVYVSAQTNDNSHIIIDNACKISGTSYANISTIEIKQLLDSLDSSIKNSEPNHFLTSLSLILGNNIKNFNDEPLWQAIITEIRRIYIPHLKTVQELSYVEDLFHSARIHINDFVRRSYGYLKVFAEKEFKEFRDISEELVSIIEMEDIFKLLTQDLDFLGIEVFILSLYDNEKNTTTPNPNKSRLVFAYVSGNDLTPQYKNKVFMTQQLLPEGILSENKSYSLLIEPIFFGGYQLGIAIFQLKEKKDSEYNIMRKMFFNSALKAAIYVKQVQIHSFNLESQVAARTDALFKANRLLAKLYQERKVAEDKVKMLNEDLEQRVLERTVQLETANKKLQNTLETLQSTKNKLVQSEKMAALGSLVAGVAHEINTPIGIGVTAASHMDTITHELSDKYAKENLKQSDLEKFVKTAQAASKMILVNLRRAYELIRSFKKIAVDQSSEEKREFNVKEYINEILMSLQPQLKKTSHTITIECPIDIVMDSYPGPFSQIITNLVMNSLIHAYEKNDKGNIHFNITTEDNTLILTYNDDGKGILPDHIEKIFNPFFTTKRNKGGTGLGLNLLYNIVTQTFGGSVKCHSTPGKGATFIIIFPSYR